MSVCVRVCVFKGFYFFFRFFVTSIEFLRGHVRTQGLFRKAGSCTRQKGLRVSVKMGDLFSAIYGCDHTHFNLLISLCL